MKNALILLPQHVTLPEMELWKTSLQVCKPCLRGSTMMTVTLICLSFGYYASVSTQLSTICMGTRLGDGAEISSKSGVNF